MTYQVLQTFSWNHWPVFLVILWQGPAWQGRSKRSCHPVHVWLHPWHTALKFLHVLVNLVPESLGFFHNLMPLLVKFFPCRGKERIFVEPLTPHRNKISHVSLHYPQVLLQWPDTTQLLGQLISSEHHTANQNWFLLLLLFCNTAATVCLNMVLSCPSPLSS